MSRSYRNYIFDLYGTLVDIHTDEDKPQLWERFSLYLRGKGILYDPQELKDIYRSICLRRQTEAEERLCREGIPGPAEIDILDVWRIILGNGKAREKENTAMHGCESLPEAELREISRVFRGFSTEKLRLFPGAKELLERLRKEGKRIVLLTNAQASFTKPELEQLGISGAFDRIFISSDARVKKPSAAFFKLPAQYGYLPKVSVMIGNDDVCDCRGAAAAGMDSIYIRTEQSPEPVGPLPDNCREIADLSQV